MGKFLDTLGDIVVTLVGIFIPAVSDIAKKAEISGSNRVLAMFNGREYKPKDLNVLISDLRGMIDQARSKNTQLVQEAYEALQSMSIPQTTGHTRDVVMRAQERAKKAYDAVRKKTLDIEKEASALESDITRFSNLSDSQIQDIARGYSNTNQNVIRTDAISGITSAVERAKKLTAPDPVPQNEAQVEQTV